MVCGGVIRRQEPHEVEAAGVEARVPPRPHHQDPLGVVVEGGDASRHADGEGEPGHTDGDAEEEERNTKCFECVTKYSPIR